MAYERADPEHAVLLLDPVEPLDAVDVDQGVDRGDAELQHGDQALAPGHHLRAFALPEGRHHLLERRRCEVVEARWIHRTLLSWDANERSGPRIREGRRLAKRWRPVPGTAATRVPRSREGRTALPLARSRRT